MKVKQYTANTLQEAMLKVKHDLGRDAVILHTRRIKKGGFLGFFTHEVFEVTATIEARVAETRAPIREQASTTSDSRVAALEVEMNNIRYAVESVLRHQPAIEREKPLAALREILITNDVDPIIADKFLRDITVQIPGGQDALAARKLLEKMLCCCLSRVEGIKLLQGRPKVVALLGPTGVGKTTTIAKLAANFALVEGKQVALITADTYRIAAVEQLKTYAEIIGVPIDVVFTREELKDALARRSDKDLILIDTAGRSPKNDKHVLELQHLLGEQPDLEIHLVVSATTKPKDALDIVTRFAPSDVPYKLIITKVDESSTFGAIVNIMYNSTAVLSYLANGQSVPDDIELADPEKLTSLILKDPEYA